MTTSLQFTPKPNLEAFLKDGVVNGFKLVDISAELTAVDMNNYKSTTDPSTKAKVEQVIGEKIMQGNALTTTIRPTVVGALGSIPKPNSTKIRLILHCSRPHGQAGNDYIITRFFKFQ